MQTMEKESSKIYSVSEICDGKVKLLSQSGEALYLEKSALPPIIREGDMLRFDGEVRKDKAATAARRKSIKHKADRLIKK